MKVTFVYTDHGQYNQNNFNRGVAVLSSCLKLKGHRTSLLHISRRIDRGRFKEAVKIHRPDLIAFSFISNMFSQVKQFSVWVKEMNIPAVHGGMHPTIAPEECLAQEGISAIVRGEGECAITDFCQALESSKDIKNIPNIWVKEGGRIYRNPPRGLIENLDTLPYPDYELFGYENLEEGVVHKILVSQASRGCNYNCTYCCNHVLRSLYNRKTTFVRYYGVDRLLDEIEAGLKKYPFLKEVRFYDDTITQDKDWFREFAVKYRRRIALPYSGNERVENIEDETALLLKESGCVSLDLGIESGSRFIRERYMNRRISDEKIIEAFRLLRSNGINANSFNILGMVGETPETVLETIKLNALARPSITFNAYFYPFKGTKAYELVRERNYGVEGDVADFFSRPVVALDTIKRSQLVFFHKYFYLLMKIYGFLSGESRNRDRIAKALDSIVASRYFPYALFNFFHFGKDDMLVILRRSPKAYMLMRKIYRSIRKKAKIRIAPFFKDIYLASRRFPLGMIGIFVKKKGMDEMRPKSLLAIRIDRIGDLMVTLPALKALRRIFPEARISVLAAEENAPLLTVFPWIDEVITYRGFIRTVGLLRKKGFGLAVDFLMDYPLKTALLTLLSGSGFTAGFDIAGRGDCFNLGVVPAGRKHVSVYMLDLAHAVAKASFFNGRIDEEARVEFPVPKEDKEYIRSLIEKNGIGQDDMIVGVHPGGHYASQRWPVERFAGLAGRIIKKYNAKVIITGSLGERALIDEMARMMKEGAVKVIGLPLNRLAALVAITDLFICNNSGPWHIACALNKRTVSTMGPTNHHLWWPAGGEHIVIRKGLSCSPCDLAVCGSHACMKMISIEDMMDAAEVQIEKIKNRRSDGNGR